MAFDAKTKTMLLDKTAQSLGVDCPEDTEGWMAERPTYWLDLPEAEPPSRLAWLRHRAREAASLLGVRIEDPWKKAGNADAEWRRLSEIALGPLPPAPGELRAKSKAQAGAKKPGAGKQARNAAASIALAPRAPAR